MGPSRLEEELPFGFCRSSAGNIGRKHRAPRRESHGSVTKRQDLCRWRHLSQSCPGYGGGSDTNRRHNIVKACFICIPSILNERSNYARLFVHHGKSLERLLAWLALSAPLSRVNVDASFINPSPDKIYIGCECILHRVRCRVLLFQLSGKCQTGNSQAPHYGLSKTFMTLG